MAKPVNTAASLEECRTDRPLADIASDHATSRTLSARTRLAFGYIATNVPVDSAEREDAFFEAAASVSTRFGNSWTRRTVLGDLKRLQDAVRNGDPIQRDRYYTMGLPVTIRVQPDGTVTAYVDITEAADLAHDTLNAVTVKHDAELVGVAVDNRTIAIEIA